MEYKDSYKSWSPRKCSKNPYKVVHDEIPLSFGDAIEILKQGGAIRERMEWKRMFVIKQVPDAYREEYHPEYTVSSPVGKDLILHGKGFIDYQVSVLSTTRIRVMQFMGTVYQRYFSKIGKFKMNNKTYRFTLGNRGMRNHIALLMRQQGM